MYGGKVAQLVTKDWKGDSDQSTLYSTEFWTKVPSYPALLAS